MSGFLGTFSFLSTEDAFSGKNLLKYYFLKIFRFLPLLVMVNVFALFLIPFIGTGPYWNTYDTVMAPCKTYWWTTLLFVNNIYPTSGYDEKCMPWAWYIPALVQLSLLLPPILAIYVKLVSINKTAVRFFFGTIIALSFIACGVVTYSYDLGALPFLITSTAREPATDPNETFSVSFDFYSKVYMQSYFHLGSYVAGIALATSYKRFLQDRAKDRGEGREHSRSSRFYEAIMNNSGLRYSCYMMGALLCFFSMLWQQPFVTQGDKMSRFQCALYNALSPLIFLLGFACFWIPALVGKACFFRKVFGSGIWLAFSNLSATIYLIGPIMSLWYSMSVAHQIDFGFYTQQYAFDGNLVFTFIFSVIVAIMSDRPYLAFVSLPKDLKLAENDEDNDLAEF